MSIYTLIDGTSHDGGYGEHCCIGSHDWVKNKEQYEVDGNTKQGPPLFVLQQQWKHISLAVGPWCGL